MKERSSVVRYLVDHHGLSALQPFTKVDLESLNTKIEAKSKKRSIYAYEIRNEKLDTAFALLKVKDLGINYDRAENYFNIVNANRGLIDAKGYDAVFLIDGLSDSTKRLNGMQLIVTQKSEKKELRILTKVEVVVGAEATVAFDLNNLTKAVYQAYQSNQLLKNGKVYVYPSEKMQFYVTSDPRSWPRRGHRASPTPSERTGCFPTRSGRICRDTPLGVACTLPIEVSHGDSIPSYPTP